ncbi:MAG: hypothetical protein V2A54_14120 [Bacteroidota bacterium]
MEQSFLFDINHFLSQRSAYMRINYINHVAEEARRNSKENELRELEFILCKIEEVEADSIYVARENSIRLPFGEEAQVKNLIKDRIISTRKLLELTKGLKKTIAVTSFDSTLKEDQLILLHSKLIDKEFIDSATHIEPFKAVFLKKTEDEINTPIRWIDLSIRNKNASINAATLFELLYLLRDAGFIEKSDFDTGGKKINLYKKMLICFSDKDGKEIKHLKGKTHHSPKQNTERKMILSEIVNGLNI